MIGTLRIFALACGLAALSASARQTAVAMLEDVGRRQVTESGETVDVYSTRLRAVFMKGNGQWLSVCPGGSDSEECDANGIALFETLYSEFRDDKRRPFMTSGLKKREFCCHDIGWLEIPAGLNAETSKGRLPEFGGWPGLPAATPKTMTNSERNVSDPERWRISKPSASASRLALTALARILQETSTCKAYFPEQESRSAAIPAALLKVKKSFKNVRGTELLIVGLSTSGRKACRPKVHESQEFLDDVGDFVVVSNPDRSHVVHRVLPNTGWLSADLSVLEFGDFDADGKTEVVLFYSGYNRDGYVLLHSGMTKKVEFLWGYH